MLLLSLFTQFVPKRTITSVRQKRSLDGINNLNYFFVVNIQGRRRGEKEEDFVEKWTVWETGWVWIMRTWQAACFSRYSKRAFTDLSARWRFAVVEFPDILVRASADELQPLVRGHRPGAVFSMFGLLPPPNPCLLNLPLFGLRPRLA